MKKTGVSFCLLAIKTLCGYWHRVPVPAWKWILDRNRIYLVFFDTTSTRMGLSIQKNITYLESHL